ncbi:MAG: hypothetical protein KDD50_13825 [Bdellovibrionales bacterium]|nr:hypothetical protein [Bdellovibrionales bacterium]
MKIFFKGSLILLLIQITLPALANLEFTDFKQRILEKKSNSVAKALLQLPEEYLENYTLVKNSQSLQSGTMLNPRAILFGDSGKTIYTFSGDPDLRGYSSIETVEAGEDNLYFRSVIFLQEEEFVQGEVVDKKTIAEQTALEEDEIEYFDDRVVISKPNPRACMGCHSLDPQSFQKTGFARYIWSRYSSWPDVYGSNDDSLIQKEKSKNEEDEGFDKIDLATIKQYPHKLDADHTSALRTTRRDKAELLAFLKYKEKAKSHPRYQLLKSLNQTFPYHSTLQLIVEPGEENGGAFVGSYNPYPEIDTGFRTLGNMPNTRLSMMFQYHLSKIYARRLGSTKRGKQKEIIGEVCLDRDALFEKYGDLFTNDLSLSRVGNPFNSGSNSDLAYSTLYFYFKYYFNDKKQSYEERDMSNYESVIDKPSIPYKSIYKLFEIYREISKGRTDFMPQFCDAVRAEITE